MNGGRRCELDKVHAIYYLVYPELAAGPNNRRPPPPARTAGVSDAPLLPLCSYGLVVHYTVPTVLLAADLD